MKNIVPVPVTPTPWERRRPNSFDKNIFQVSLSGPWRSFYVFPFLPESSVEWGLEAMLGAVLHKWEM